MASGLIILYCKLIGTIFMLVIVLTTKSRGVVRVKVAKMTNRIIIGLAMTRD
jgi:hypothetical protein